MYPKQDYGTMASTDPAQSAHTWSSSGSENPDLTGEPVTFDDLGLRRETATIDTYFGKRRPLSNLSPKEIAFCVISFISILAATGLTIERIVNLPPSSPDMTFAMVLLLNLCFCLFYVANGVIGERPYELLIFIGGTLVLMIYCIVNYVQTAGSETTKKNEKNIKLARLVIITAVGPVCMVMGGIIARDYYLSRNLIFRTVGANLELQNLCSKIFFTEGLFKVDLQLELTLIILVLKQGVMDLNTLEIVVLVVGSVYSFSWFILGFMAMRYENKVMTIILLAFSVCEPAYIIYKIVDVILTWSGFSKYKLIPAAIIIAGSLGLAIRIILVGYMIYVFRNFGKGIREKAYGTLKPAINKDATVDHADT